MESIKIEKTYTLLIEKLLGWWEAIVLMLPNVVVAFLVMGLFILLAKFGKRLMDKLSNRFTNREMLNGLISQSVYLVIICVGIFLALEILKLDKAVTSLLAGAGIVGLALSFAFQDTASNFVAGVFLVIRKPLKIGDVIKSNDTMGVVHQMNLRNTVVSSFQGQLIYVPNKNIYQETLINYSSVGNRRVDLEVGVSYSDDLEKVEKIVIEVILSLDFVKEKENVRVYYDKFDSSSINFILMFWVDYLKETDYLMARSEAIKSIKKAFDKNGITIPFPIRTLDFDAKIFKDQYLN